MIPWWDGTSWNWVGARARHNRETVISRKGGQKFFFYLGRPLPGVIEMDGWFGVFSSSRLSLFFIILFSSSSDEPCIWMSLYYHHHACLYKACCCYYIYIFALKYLFVYLNSPQSSGSRLGVSMSFVVWFLLWFHATTNNCLLWYYKSRNRSRSIFL